MTVLGLFGNRYTAVRVSEFPYVVPPIGERMLGGLWTGDLYRMWGSGVLTAFPPARSLTVYAVGEDSPCHRFFLPVH